MNMQLQSTEILSKDLRKAAPTLGKKEVRFLDECDDDMFSAAAKKSVASVVDNFDDDIPF